MEAQPSGVGTALSATAPNVESNMLPVPQACTVSNLNVSVKGASGTSLMHVAIITGTFQDAQTGNYILGPACTIAAANGSLVTCSAGSQSLSVDASEFLYLFLSPEGSQAQTDFENARVYTSFTCQ